MKYEKKITICLPEESLQIKAFSGTSLATALILNGFTSEDWKVTIDTEIPFTETENRILGDEEKNAGVHLAYELDNEKIEKVQLSGRFRKGLQPAYECAKTDDPRYEYRTLYITGKHMNLPAMFQMESEALYDRIANAAEKEGYRMLLDAEELKKLIVLDRPGRPVIAIKALVDNRNHTVLSLSAKEKPVLGAAIVLDNEMISMLITDLLSGEEIAHISSESLVYKKLKEDADNQKPATEDGFEKLHDLLQEQIQGIFNDLSKDNPDIDYHNVLRTVVIGKNPLLHLFLNIPPVDTSHTGSHSVFYQDMQVCPYLQVPQMNPGGELLVLQQFGNRLGSDALVMCNEMLNKRYARILMLQPTSEGFAFLQNYSKFSCTSAWSAEPDTEEIRAYVGSLLGEMQIFMPDLERVYVLVPPGTEIWKLREKVEKALPRVNPDRIFWLDGAAINGGKSALLSNQFIDQMKNLKKITKCI